MTWYVKKGNGGRLAVVNYDSPDSLSDGFHSHVTAFEELGRLQRRANRRRSAWQGVWLGVLFGLIMISAVPS